MKPAAFAYHRAAGVEDALALLARYGPEGGRVLAGGQSLVPLMALRLAQPPHLIDINRVEFGALRVERGALCIPACVRHAEVTGPGALGPALREVGSHIAHLPIRSRGTFCGSLAHADPSAEWPLVFATLGGEAVMRRTDGKRVVGAGDFVVDIMTTALAADELLTEVRLAVPGPEVRFGFFEVSRRAGDYAMAMAFVAVSLRDGMVTQARVGVGGAERRARGIAAAEVALVGHAAGETSFSRAADAAAADVDPMEYLQAGAGFRRDLVRTVVRRALQRAAS